MKKTTFEEDDPLVLEASMTGDMIDLVLTRAGYETMEEALALLRETNPNATYNDVIMWMVRNLIEKLEAEMN